MVFPHVINQLVHLVELELVPIFLLLHQKWQWELAGEHQSAVIIYIEPLLCLVYNI